MQGIFNYGHQESSSRAYYCNGCLDGAIKFLLSIPNKKYFIVRNLTKEAHVFYEHGLCVYSRGLIWNPEEFNPNNESHLKEVITIIRNKLSLESNAVVMQNHVPPPDYTYTSGSSEDNDVLPAYSA